MAILDVTTNGALFDARLRKLYGVSEEKVDDSEEAPEIDPFCANCGVVFVGDEDDLCTPCFENADIPQD